MCGVEEEFDCFVEVFCDGVGVEFFVGCAGVVAVEDGLGDGDGSVAEGYVSFVEGVGVFVVDFSVVGVVFGVGGGFDDEEEVFLEDAVEVGEEGGEFGVVAVGVADLGEVV